MARERDDDRYDDDRRERSPRRDDEDRPRRRDRYDDRPQSKQTSVLGIFSLIGSIGALVGSFVPCLGAVAIASGAISLTLGIIGLVLARNSNGRVGTGLPLAGTIISGIAMLIGLIWLIFMAGLFGIAATLPTTPVSGNPGMSVSPSDPVAASVTALELSKAFADDKDATDAKYQGKVVEVSGKVKGVTDTGETDDIKVALEGFNLAGVNCYFATSQRSSVNKLKDGSIVTIRGRWAGGIFDVDLNDCIVMPSGTPKPAGDGAGKGPSDGAPKVTAARLAKAFADNVVSATATYENKTLEVSGGVFATDLSDADNQIVFLGQKGKDIECRFGKENLKGQAAITTGKQVTVRGKCKGNDDGPVVLEDCKLVK